MNLQQFGIFMIGGIVSWVLCVLFHAFMKWGDEAQHKVIHHSRESDQDIEHKSDDHYQAVIKNRKDREK